MSAPSFPDLSRVLALSAEECNIPNVIYRAGYVTSHVSTHRSFGSLHLLHRAEKERTNPNTQSFIWLPETADRGTGSSAVSGCSHERDRASGQLACITLQQPLAHCLHGANIKTGQCQIAVGTTQLLR